MNTYVVAHISFFDNVLKQSIVMANTEVTAALIVLDMLDQSDIMDMQALKHLLYDMDSTVSVLQIK